MQKRTEIITMDNLDGLFLNHPYLQIFQKNDWKEYLIVLVEIYNFLEDENTKVPFEVLKSLLYQYYSKQVQNVDIKISDFFTMTIVELGVLKDSHDQYGKRYVEPTGHGKELFKLLEGMIAQRTRFTGTSAETLLASLNNLLLGAEEMSKEDALKHHKEKIKAYQEDIKRIEKSGTMAAELLPIRHSAEALFNQAEEAAIFILTAAEDVKTSIEKARLEISENYLRQTASAGANLKATLQFHLQLNQTAEYRSYMQAKDLFSHMPGGQYRFKNSDVQKLLSQIKGKKILDTETLKRSHLSHFSSQFKMTDASIIEKKTSQVRILEQQINYALATDAAEAQSHLNTLMNLLYTHKDQTLGYFQRHPVQPQLPLEVVAGAIELNHFRIKVDPQSAGLNAEIMTTDEMKGIAEALLLAEEKTIQSILEALKLRLRAETHVALKDYKVMGMAEFYVLSEADLLDLEISKSFTDSFNLKIQSRYGDFIAMGTPNYIFEIRKDKGS